MDGEDSMGSAAGIVNMCSCCDSRKKNKPFNYKGLLPCLWGNQNQQIQQINEKMWNLENMAGCILGSDPWAFGREHGKVKTGSIWDVFFHQQHSEESLKAALQHRYKVWHKQGTQQRSAASNSTKQLIPNTECTSPAHLPLTPFLSLGISKGFKNLPTQLLGLLYPGTALLHCQRSPVRLSSAPMWVLNEYCNSMTLTWTDGSHALTQRTLARRNCSQKEQ